MGSYNSIGIIAGLIMGKPIGILLSCRIVVAATSVRLPKGVRWKHLSGAATLGGIGFTMSIFISNLAFGATTVASYAKVSVLIGSSIASLTGLAILFSIRKVKKEKGYER